MENLTIQYINHWIDPFTDRWLFKFIKHHFGKKYNVIEVNNKDECDILICSVSGNLNLVKNINAKLKIFYSGENLNRDRYKKFNNINLLKNNFDLIIGFNETDINNKIIKFPIWFFLYNFYDIDTSNNILNYIKNEREKNLKIEKNYFASCISKHNINNTRGYICDKMSIYGNIIYAGKFRKNFKLGKKWEDKINFLKSVKFNICPENSISKGYCTEKIFQAFESGCIPIYWGWKYPEENILNNKSYIYANIDDNEEIEKKIKYGIENYEKIINENIFKENAEIYVKEYYDSLKNNIKKFIK